MLLPRKLIFSLPLALLAASCGPPPDPTPPKTEPTPPPATATATATAEAAPEAAPSAAPAGKMVSISAATACAVVAGGKVACWGDNSRQIIKAGAKGPEAKPVLISGIEQAVAVQVGRNFGCALTKAGKVHCFREGKTRELSLLEGVVDIALRETVVIAVKKNGSLAAIDLGYEAKDTSPSEVPELKGITAITASYYHTCALHKNGEVTCWGDPEYTGAGINTEEMDYEERNKLAKEPVKPKGLADAVAISASDTHTCAVRKNKQISCWGSNWSGELGDGSQDRRNAPVAVQLLDDATAVTAGNHHTCARRASGKVICWGESRAGQLGSGTPGARGMTEVQGITDAVSIGAGEEVSCAVLASGGVSCWGAAARGRLGNGTNSDYTTPQPVKGVSGVKLLGAGDRYSCFVDASKQLSCWGTPGFADSEGKRGDAPKVVSGISDVEALITKESALCVIDKGKNVFCDSAWSFFKEPKPLKIGAVKAISSGGGSFGSAVLPSGQVVLWQREWQKPENVLKQNLSGLSDAVSVANDSSAVCAVRKSGKVGCVGYSYRTFDKKDPIKPTAAVEVPDITDGVSIASGSGDMCVLRKNGEVSCFSSYRVPAPVDPKKPKEERNKPQPFEVKVLKGVAGATQLTMASGARCVLTKEGAVWCWGSNTYGQLGLGDYEYHWEPTQVPGLSDVAIVSSGGNHVCAAKKSGEVLCWGRNVSDECAQSAPAYAYSPVAVQLPN